MILPTHPYHLLHPRLVRIATALLSATVLTVLLLLSLRSFAPAHGAPARPLAADLQIDKRGPNVIGAGQWITYTILVTNASGIQLEGIVITDTWTQQYYTGTYETEGNVVVNSTTLVQQPVRYMQFNLAPMPAGAIGLIRARMWISTSLQPTYDGNPTVLGNSVVITTTTPGRTAGTDNVNTTVVGPLLRLTKTASPGTVRPGYLITFTFALANKNRSDAIDATNVVISESLPSYLMFYSAYPPGQVIYYPITRTVQWNMPSVAVSTTVYVTLTARVTPTQPYGGTNNPQANCRVYADGLPTPVQCYQAASFTVDNTLEKTTRTVSPPPQSGTISRTFPNRVLTYTVYAYNPFTETLSLRITDTLPQYPSGPIFQYRDMPPQSNPPTLASANANVVAWDTPQIQAWGVYSFSFRAFVPPNMPIDVNQPQRRYINQVGGSRDAMPLASNNGNNDASMQVDVVPQILTPKTVVPTTQIIGLPVTYTLIISNSGPTTISSIRITDTLPTVAGQCTFIWDRLISGLVPISTTSNMAVWDGITLPGYQQTTMVFTAIVNGSLNATCNNTIEGTSPDTFIVKRTNLAPVRVDVPFRFAKSVQPSSVVLGGDIEYTVTEFNIGGINATMSGFTDTLPAGFYYGSSPVYYNPASMTLLANHANEYATTFPVKVVSTSVSCDSLPTSVPQAVGKFGMKITDPPELTGFWVNAVAAAPVTLQPQVKATKQAIPPAVFPGGTVTFVITLTNSIATPITQVRVIDTLPNGFQYVGVLPGTPTPVSTVPPNVAWTEQDIPASGVRVFAFTATASTAVNNYVNAVKADSVSDPLICIPKITTNVAVKPATVRASSKTASPTSVGPLGLVTYDIALTNDGPIPIPVLRFTDTLPGLPGYTWKFVSMQSGDPQPISTNPPVWENMTIAAGTTLHLRFIVRTGTQFGTYPNLPASTPPPMGAGQFTGTMPSGWTLYIPVGVKADVTVIPGVGMDKEVAPAEAIIGNSVVYTITLVNLSGVSINNVRVTDTLPTGFTFESMVAGDVPLTTSPLVWSWSSIQSGDQYKKVLAFRVRIGSTLPSGTYYNRVDARSDNILIPSTDKTAPVIVHGLPTLQLSKSVEPEQIKPGREVTYTLVLVNAESQDITARITDTLPNTFTFVAMVSGPVPDQVAPQVVWSNLTVPAHTTTTLVMRALAALDAPDGVYYNRLDGSSQSGRFIGTGPTAPVEVTAPRFDVQVFKTDGTPVNEVGGTAVYTIYYTNTLNTLNLTATNVVLTETFSPADYLDNATFHSRAVEVSSQGGMIRALDRAHVMQGAPADNAPLSNDLLAGASDWNLISSGVYTRRIGDLPAGASGWVTFALNIRNDLPIEYLTITNTVEIGAQPPEEMPDAFEQPTSNNVSTDIDIVHGADLLVTNLTYAPARLRQNGFITVWVTLVNQGPDPTLGPDGKGWFGTDLYIKPSGSAPPTGPGDRYLGACPSNTNYCPSTIRYELYQVTKSYSGTGLASGEVWVLTYTYRLPTVGEQWLYVQADTFWGQNGDPDPTVYGSSQNGRILEGLAANNIFGPVPIHVTPNVYLPLVLRNYHR